jgi:Protein of unknown function (DUF3261)
VPRAAVARGLCLACLLAATGCASFALALARVLPDGGRECPGRLLPTGEIAAGFRVRERARVQGGDLDWRLELVAEKSGEVLVLIGLDAFGSKAFVVTQRGSDVSVERPRGRLPLPPIDLLRDLHRARLLPESLPPEPGVRIERSGDEVTIEHERCGYRIRLVTLEPESPSPDGAARP